MLLHSVYFWLHDEITDEDRERFWDGVESLLGIETVYRGYIGSPADTEDRPIIDRSYDCALILFFKDQESHDSYQEDAIHDAFRTLASLWKKVQIYDTSLKV